MAGMRWNLCRNISFVLQKLLANVPNQKVLAFRPQSTLATLPGLALFIINTAQKFFQAAKFSAEA